MFQAVAGDSLTKAVSVLFSEPKIPQFTARASSSTGATRFSALQRAENSSIATSAGRDDGVSQVSVLFSEPKIPQYNPLDGVV